MSSAAATLAQTNGNKVGAAQAQNMVGTACPECSAGIVRSIKLQYGHGLACSEVGKGCTWTAKIKAAARGAQFQPGNKAASATAKATQTLLDGEDATFDAAIANSDLFREAVTPTPKPTTPTRFAIPFDDCFTVAERCRKALEAGANSVTFGHRKLENWITLAARFHNAGIATGAAALSLAYHLTVVAREVEANRQFAVELFTAKFGNSVTPDSACVPFEDIVRFMVSQNLPLYLTGLPGVGKTYTMIEILSMMRSVRPTRQQGGGEVTMADLVGSMGYVEGQGTVWQDGTLSLSMRSGTPFIMDEMDKCRDDVQSVFVSLLESHDGSITLPTGERISPASGFYFGATGNTVGLGEGIAYEGTRVINEAIRDRLYFLSVDHMSKARAKQLIVAQVEALNQGGA